MPSVYGSVNCSRLEAQLLKLPWLRMVISASHGNSLKAYLEAQSIHGQLSILLQWTDVTKTSITISKLQVIVSISLLLPASLFSCQFYYFISFILFYFIHLSPETNFTRDHKSHFQMTMKQLQICFSG